MAKTKEVKTYRPGDLAEELGVDAKRIRAFLRADHTRAGDLKNTSWMLDEATAQAVRDRFTKASDGEES